MNEKEIITEFEKLYDAYIHTKFDATIAIGVTMKGDFVNMNLALLRGRYFNAKGKPSMSVVLTPKVITEMIKELSAVLEIFKEQTKPKEDTLEEEWETSEEI